MRIVFTFNKAGYEGECWSGEIRRASQAPFEFIPFNHHSYMDPHLYSDAVKLDRLYQARDPRLTRLYRDFEAVVRDHGADAVIVSCYPPLHPDYLRNLRIYKVLFSGDDPGATYMRNIPYLHAYQHVMFMSPSYSADMDLEQKMRQCGMVNADWVPVSVFDFEFDTTRNEDTILEHGRRLIESALAALRAERFFAAEGAHVFLFEETRDAIAAYRKRLPEMAELVKAMTIADLEVQGRYVEAKHDALFDGWGPDSLGQADLARFPDYLVCRTAQRARKGGRATKARYGVSHYQKIGRLGAVARWGDRPPRQ